MNPNDQKLADALRRSLDPNHAADDDTGTASLVRDALSALRSRSILINIGSIVAGIGMTAVAVWLAFQLFRSTDANRSVLYATGVLFCMMMVLAIKVWFWMEMERNSLLREIKRVEWLVARSVAGSGVNLTPKP